MTNVDQQKIRRVRTGLIAHDPALAQPGFTLFAPMYGDGSVFLIDMEGEVAHRWAMPYRPGLYAYLLDSADPAVAQGAQNGSEMGAFSFLLGPIKERGLALKYAEYLPLGVTPVVVHVT